MQKWEYHLLGWVISRHANEISRITKELNALGEDGWEIVFVMPEVLFLKRPKK